LCYAVSVRRSWFSLREADDILHSVADIAKEWAPSDPRVDVDCAKLARQLRHSARTTVGLLPTSERARVQPLATELAFALSLLTETTSIVLDPEQASGTPPVHDGTLLYAHVPARSVVALVPFSRAPAGAKFEVVKLMLQLLERDRPSFGHVIVDLSGCRFPGELLGAVSLLDGIIVVGPSGEATERELLDTAKLIPSALNLGVVLTTERRLRRSETKTERGA
jgi:hypothetical protein